MRLLIVEDNEELAELLAKGLAQAGYESDVLATIEEAKSVLSTTFYAALILDLGLPDGDGLELLREIRNRNNSIPVLVLTARDAVYFGSLHLPAARLLQGELHLGAQPAESVSLGKTTIVFGRDPACDQPLNYPMISRHHARLLRRGNQLVLEDLGATNGTFVNGDRVLPGSDVRISDGDNVRLGADVAGDVSLPGQGPDTAFSTNGHRSPS